MSSAVSAATLVRASAPAIPRSSRAAMSAAMKSPAHGVRNLSGVRAG